MSFYVTCFTANRRASWKRSCPAGGGADAPPSASTWVEQAIYARTAAYGHFGRTPDKDGGFSWEKTTSLKAAGQRYIEPSEEWRFAKPGRPRLWLAARDPRRRWRPNCSRSRCNLRPLSVASSRTSIPSGLHDDLILVPAGLGGRSVDPTSTEDHRTAAEAAPTTVAGGRRRGDRLRSCWRADDGCGAGPSAGRGADMETIRSSGAVAAQVAADKPAVPVTACCPTPRPAGDFDPKSS